MANPASAHCGALGGVSEIRSGPGGQYGVCKLPDGKVCEEWALYRDKVCQPAT
jgi:putative hemolysin